MEGSKILVVIICHNSLGVAYVGKSTHTKREVAGYHEMHVIGPSPVEKSQKEQ